MCVSRVHRPAVYDVWNDAMRDSILSWQLPHCLEVESTHVRDAVRHNGVRPLRACDTDNARTAFTNLLFHATSENIRAYLNHLSVRVELDLSAFALARFLKIKE